MEVCFGAGGSRETQRAYSEQRPLVGLARYQTLQKIGEGMYGVVYKALDLVTKEVRPRPPARPCVRRVARARAAVPLAARARALARRRARALTRALELFRLRAPRAAQHVAIKRVMLDADEGVPCTAMREISLLKDANGCNNIVR